MIDLSNSEINLAYNTGLADGEANVLETLGVSRQTYDELKRLKDLGSAVLVYAKVSDPIEFEEQTSDSFIQGTCTDFVACGGETVAEVVGKGVKTRVVVDPAGKTLYTETSGSFTSNPYYGPNTGTIAIGTAPLGRTIASGSTSYGSSPIDIPQGPGAGTASGASVAEGTYKPREYDTGDPWKDSSK